MKLQHHVSAEAYSALFMCCWQAASAAAAALATAPHEVLPVGPLIRWCQRTATRRAARLYTQL